MSGDLSSRLLAGFADAYGAAPSIEVRAPGRVDAVRQAVIDGYRAPMGELPEVSVEMPAAGAGLIPGCVHQNR